MPLARGSLPGLRRQVLVFQGASQRRTEDGIDVLPVADFLRDVESGELTQTR